MDKKSMAIQVPAMDARVTRQTGRSLPSQIPSPSGSHPTNYEFEFPPPAAESNILRTQSLCDMPVSCMARSISFRSSWFNLTDIPGALAFALGTFGRPTSIFIKYVFYYVNND
jgi:hypothetical protein